MLPEKAGGGTLKAASGDNLGRMPGRIGTLAASVSAVRLKFSRAAPIAIK